MLLYVIAVLVDVSCSVCSSEDDTDNILGHFFQCIWCQRFSHQNCINQFEQVNNFYQQSMTFKIITK